MGLLFYPRGGSAHVARNLATALPQAGWDATIVSGSVTLPNHPGDATAFYEDLDVRPVDMTARAQRAPTRWPATRRCIPPTRTGPTRRTASSRGSTTSDAEHQVTAWARALQSVGAAELRRPAPAPPDAALRGRGPRRARRADRRPPARHRAADARGDRGGPAPLALRPRLGRAPARLGAVGAAADRAHRTRRPSAPSACSGSTPSAACRSPTASTPTTSARATSTTARSGAGCSSTSRAAGRPTRSPAASATRPRRSTPFSDGDGETPVLLYVGRYTEVKRIPLLIEAYERARPGFNRRSPLVIVGGFPGEWEGEHPYDTIRRIGAQRRLPRRLARPPRAGRHPRRRRRDRAAVGPRAVRAGARRGHGLRAAADRRRRLRPGRHRRPRRDGLAGRARRRRRA